MKSFQHRTSGWLVLLAVFAVFATARAAAETRYFIIGAETFAREGINLTEEDIVQAESYFLGIEDAEDIAYARELLRFNRDGQTGPVPPEGVWPHVFTVRHTAADPDLPQLGLNREYLRPGAPPWTWSVEHFEGWASSRFTVYITPSTLYQAESDDRQQIVSGTVIGEYPIHFTWFDQADTAFKSSPWFGRFHDRQWPWIYSEDHGWIYNWGSHPFFGQDPHSMYLHMAAEDEVYWTSEGTYPWLYCYRDGAWLYFARTIPGQRWFYNASTQNWETLARPSARLPGPSD